MTKVYVICDFCGKDYTDSPQTGGFLFGSKATCPECAPRMMDNIKKFNEERYIKSYCPTGMTFYNWVVVILKGGIRAENADSNQ